LKVYIRHPTYKDNWILPDDEKTLESLLEFLEKNLDGKWEKGG